MTTPDPKAADDGVLSGCSHLRVERHDSVAVVVLDRPPVNALDTAGYRCAATELADLDRDDEVRAIVLTGAGTRAFSAGTDTASLTSVSSVTEVCEAALHFFTTLSALDTPMVGALNGPAVGGGAMIAAECDVLVAISTANLAVPELQLGFPGGGSHLKRLVPYPTALRMVLIGERPDAYQLLAMGTLAEVVDTPDALRIAALRHAQVIAGLDLAALVPARRIIRQADAMAALQGYREELDHLRAILLDRLTSD
ncbi:enoyl-CoA hydratase/isomerase family protein [Streptomyces sp. NPDC047081]|uniref:enoyl-CoA hydratase/isomerase family protein n=1 Tax=Streptomyces sp. NPDC047081 TaxID=3154706 RepID=UPI0033E7CF83